MRGDPIEICCICHKEIDVRGTWTKGHNAEPVTEGRCCTECNSNVVLPVRMMRLIKGRYDAEGA
jgi:hypothetical protein